MTRQTIAELVPGVAVDEVYALQAIEIRSARNHSTYLTFQISDRTGTLDGIKWDAPQQLYQHLRESPYVQVRGKLETYRNNLQLVATGLRPVPTEAVQVADFLPHTDKDIETMMQQLSAAVDSIQNHFIRELLHLFLDDSEFVSAFKQAPAAVSYHHPFVGGLLEHICSVIWVTDQITGHYEQLNRDLMIAGIFLHDIGKVRELTVGGGFKYSDEGELVGHISLGTLMVQERASHIDGFPPEILTQLIHLILSHHGELEYGSPKVPMTLEAIALHHLENLDAKINAFAMALDTDLQAGDNWTRFNRMFGRRLFKTQINDND